MTNIFLKIKEGVIFVFLLFVAVLLAFRKGYSDFVLEGIGLWALTLLPALFPYIFITEILNSLSLTGKLSRTLTPLTKRLWNTGGAVGYAFMISLLSGSPIGAKTVATLRENNYISDAEGVRASAICSTSSPMFTIGSVGNIMFGNTLFGVLLFITNVLSAVIIGIIYSFYKRKEKGGFTTLPPPKKMDNVIYDSVYSSIISVLVVGGIVVLFYLLTEILYSLGILNVLINPLSNLIKNPELGKGIVFGTFECTKGLKIIASCEYNIFSLPLSAMLCGFGGISIIVQSTAYLKMAKINTAPFILSKIISAVLHFLIGLLLSYLFLF